MNVKNYDLSNFEYQNRDSSKNSSKETLISKRNHYLLGCI